MDIFESVDDILDFAIAGEVAANQFYMDLAGKMKKPEIAKAFEELAEEELGHKAKLEAIKRDKTLEPIEKVTDLKLVDYLVSVEPQFDMDYQKALILAMKKEKAAYKLYTHLAAIAENENLADTFLRLAQEEARHKLVLEIEYDDVVLKED